MLLSIATGVGAVAPSPVSIKDNKNTSQKLTRNLNKENEQENYSYTLTQTFWQSEYTNRSNVTPSSVYGMADNLISTYNVKETSVKYEKTAYNNYVMIKTNRVDQTLTWNNPDTAALRQALIQPELTWYETTSMYKIQINPYTGNRDTSYTIRFRIIFSTGVDVTEGRSEHIQYQVKTYQTTDSDAGQYIDQGNWANYRQNGHIYAALTSPQNGYTYQEDVSMTEKYLLNETTQTVDTPVVEIERDIAIVSGKTNYIYILVNPIYVDDPYHVSSNDYLWVDQNSTNQYLDFFIGDSTITFSGIGMPSINNYEVVDIPGMMWEILAMPFAFISTAFNLTLFPGTPYQVNISNLILMVFGVLVFIFIFKLLLKK